MINLLHLTREQREYFWEEFEKAEQEFEENMEETAKRYQEEILENLFEDIK